MKSGGRERRYWLGADSRYGIDIAASTLIGSDPRDTIAWSSSRVRCDISSLRGACELTPPSWKRWRYEQLSGTYQPLVGDFDGNGRDDICWNGPDDTADSL